MAQGKDRGLGENSDTELASVTPNFPQAAYSSLQKYLQEEWQFVQRRVIKDILARTPVHTS
jgi:hypothetical protein